MAPLDIGKAMLVACARVPHETKPGRRRQQVRSFATTTRSLLELADWLGCVGVTRVVMASTSTCWSTCWKSPWYLLEPYAGTETDLVGVSCLAGGPDQLFARIVLELGGTLVVVVPAAHYRNGLDPDEQVGYDELLARAKHTERLPFVASTEQAHLAAGQAVVDQSDQLVAVWDGQPARGLGGTADIVGYARQQGVPVTVVWPEGATR